MPPLPKPYRIWIEQDLLVIRFEGGLSGPILKSVLGEVEGIEKDRERVPNRLTVIAPGIDPDLSFLSMMQASGDRRERVFPNRFKSAIVASTSLQKGFVRMYQQLIDNPWIEHQYFDDEAEARLWLATPPL